MPTRIRGTASRVAMTACLAAIGTTAFASQAQAQNICSTLLGATNCDVTTDTLVSPLLPVTGTLDVTVNSATDLLGSVVADATGAVNLAANTDILSNAANAPALSLTSDDAIDATVQSLTTSGANATAALLRAGAGVTLQALGPVTTSGDGSDGVNVLSSSIDLTAGAVQTLGADADGLELVSLNGPIALDADLHGIPLSIGVGGLAERISRNKADILATMREVIASFNARRAAARDAAAHLADVPGSEEEDEEDQHG